MAIKRPRRGISVGTIVVLSLTLLSLLLAGVVFLRISGDISEISIDPSMITEPINVLVRSVTDTGDDGGAPQGSANTPIPPPAESPTPAPTITATPEPTLPPVRTLSLSAVGQVSMGAELRTAGQSGGAYVFDDIFAPITSSISGSDIGVVTLRAGLTDDASAFSGFIAPSPLANSLSSTGFTLANLATERVLDGGTAALGTTLDVLARTGMDTSGGYRNSSERQGTQILEVNGIKVGVLAYTTALSNAGRGAASESEIAAGMRLLTTEQAAAEVSALRSQGAELIIVLPHWGTRTDTRPTRDMQEAADALAGAGADIILGTRPTNVQTMERKTITDSTGRTRDVFIAYSLGTFLTDESRDTAAITGVILHLDIQWDATAQKATFQSAWYMPTWIMRWRDEGGVNRYRIIPAGTTSTPENMTSGVYDNMNKAYQSMVNTLGTSAATPKAE